MKCSIAAGFALALASLAAAADAPAPAPKTETAPAQKPAAAPAKTAAPALPFKSDDQRAIYAYGYRIGQSLEPRGFSAAEIGILTQGLREAAAGKKSAVDMNVYLPKVGELIQKRAAVKAEAAKKKGKAFAEKFAKQKGVKPIKEGGWIQTLVEGNGPLPKEDDTVQVNYRGTLIDGTEFDSSYKRGEPATFPLRNVIPCWTNGVAMMKVGGKAKLVCPSDAAYGDAGHPPVIPGGSTLVFEVELMKIVKPEAGAEEAAPKAAPEKSEAKPAGK